MPGKRPGFTTLFVCITSMALALTLAGCAQLQVESEFQEDGSANHALSLSLDRTFLDGDMLGSEIGDDFNFDVIEEQAEEAGLESDRIDSPERTGIRLSTDVENNENLGQILSDLYSATGGAMLGEAPAGAFDGGFSGSDDLGGGDYRFELTVNADTLFNESLGQLEGGDLEGELDSGFNPAMIQQFINFTYTATMPGELTDHNGQELGSSTVQWELPVEGTETFIAESEGSSSFPVALVIGIGIGVIALVLVVVGGLTLMRGQKTPTAPPAAV